MNQRRLIGFGVAALVVIADLVTKRYAAIRFDDNPVTVIPNFLEFVFVENSGGAFGSFQDGGAVIALAAMVVTVVVIIALVREKTMFGTVIFGLVLGGALGNLIDRFARGEGLFDGPVIDWIVLWFIPTFNVADAAVSIAVALLLIQAWRNR